MHFCLIKKYLSFDILPKSALKTRFCPSDTSVMVYKSLLIDHYFFASV